MDVAVREGGGTVRGSIDEEQEDAASEAFPPHTGRMGRFGQIVSQARLIWLAGRGGTERL